MRRLILSALLAFAPTTLAAAPPAPPPTVQSVPAPPLRPTAPAPAPASPTSAAAPFQNGQTWLLEGRTDQGQVFRSELLLGPPSADEQRAFQEGVHQGGSAARFAASFAGAPRGEGQPYLLMVASAGGESVVMAMPSPLVDGLLAAPEGELEGLSFCLLLADPGGRSFSGLSLRMREEGETYTVTGTVKGGQDNLRAELLATLRASFAPTFGVGECKLTRR